MALQVADVGQAPVDIAAALGLSGRVTLENLGIEPLRFAPAAAASEAPPDDRGAGFLLEPGEREDVQVAAGAPLWVWSARPTAVLAGPRLDGQ